MSSSFLHSPMRRLGGKQRAAPFLIRRMPLHVTYVEAFAGACSLLLNKPPAHQEVASDLDPDIATLFRILQTDPDALLKTLNNAPIDAREYHRLRNLPYAERRDPIIDAYRIFYTNWGGWGGRARPNKHMANGRPKIPDAIARLNRDIDRITERIKRVTFTCRDYREVLEEYDGLDVLFFIDPPYRHNANQYKHPFNTGREHRELFERLKRLRGRWMLTHKEQRGICWRYRDYYQIGYSFPSGMPAPGGRCTPNKEVLITNYLPPDDVDCVVPQKNAPVAAPAPDHNGGEIVTPDQLMALLGDSKRLPSHLRLVK